MSFFEDASLVLIPSAQKTSKVYSVKPTDGTGDLTFTRSNDTATRVASNGLIERVRTNTLTQSGDFSSVAWTKGSLTLTAGQTDPNGGTNAFLATSTATTAVWFYQANTGAKTFSIYAKAGTKNFFSIINGIYNNGAGFDLSTQTATSVGAGSLAKIESVGNGWYRCSVYMSSAAEMLVMLADYSGGSMIIGDTMTFAFAQAETGDIATDYIATTSAAVSVGPVANVPRLDYLGSSCPRLLLEPQRTNLALYSEQLDNVVWFPTRATITANAVTSPDGSANADMITDDTFTNNVNFTEQAVLVGGAGTTYSVFVKKGTADFVSFGFFDTAFHGFVVNTTTWASTYTFGSASGFSATNYGNGWYRLTMYKAASSNQIYVSLAVQANSTGANYNGTGALNAYFWGAQIEGAAAAYATSYIPTLGAAVTRGVDFAQKTSASALIGQTEGTIFWEFEFTTSVATGHESIINIDANAGFGDTFYIIKGGSGTIAADMYVAAVLQASFSVTPQPAGTYKAALGYANNNTAFFLNGVQVGTTDTSCSVPATSRIQLGNGVFGASTDKTAQVLLFPTRLSNADLAALTA